ncbi:hypothetical protein [Paracoccus sp. T5]|uniref:hypothetical protein n=1 Tax=Paracoccus sp. T5 TaxID=3402161 RepID=UPI003AED988E
MPRLFLLLLTIIMSSLAGAGVILVLVLGHYGMLPILLAAAAGAVLAVPVTWIVTRRILAAERQRPG